MIEVICHKLGNQMAEEVNSCNHMSQEILLGTLRSHCFNRARELCRATKFFYYLNAFLTKYKYTYGLQTVSFIKMSPERTYTIRSLYILLGLVTNTELQLVDRVLLLSYYLFVDYCLLNLI